MDSNRINIRLSEIEVETDHMRRCVSSNIDISASLRRLIEIVDELRVEITRQKFLAESAAAEKVVPS